MAGPSQRPTMTMPTPSPAYSPAVGQGGAPWSNGYPEPSRASQVSSGDGDRDEGAKRNPLVDLIDTEKTYVDQLGLVIRVSSFASA